MLKLCLERSYRGLKGPLLFRGHNNVVMGSLVNESWSTTRYKHVWFLCWFIHEYKPTFQGTSLLNKQFNLDIQKQHNLFIESIVCNTTVYSYLENPANSGFPKTTILSDHYGRTLINTSIIQSTYIYVFQQYFFLLLQVVDVFLESVLYHINLLSRTEARFQVRYTLLQSEQ